ncbi:serine/threonine protein phosphatase catalytic subunit gamma, putative [Entamoeba histolytica KU27]|uniref:Serine/threonine-protein phosphatase n=1 Tax=Entamoeba histolytica KU27 TaxID=885311 RepID=M2QJX7_ENTHI|nr:serine/threonine protein phosphatase catalytic subunit gamma, putative [Entamoeba histolytica KU27]
MRSRSRSIPVESINLSNSYRNSLLIVSDPQTVPLPAVEVQQKTISQEDRVLTCSMLFSGPNGKPNLKILKEHLRRQGRLENYAAVKLIRQAADIFRSEKNILEVDAPAIIVGDIHGQFYDMLNFMDLLGSPEDNKFVFLGDYVDRGDFSTEVVFYLFALKICYSNNIKMLRGNHESRLMCEYMTFLLECHSKYNIKIYDEFVSCFDCLPLCALINQNVNGRILCMHGGLSPSVGLLEDIMKINRFTEPPSEGSLCDLLWSDPVSEWDPDSPEWFGVSRKEWEEITFKPNKQRKTSYFYGKKAVNRFLAANDLFCIVRAHQVQDNGFKDHKYFNPSRHLSEVFTIFSAPNYCDYYKNYGAVMKITTRPFDIKTFVWKQHPVVLEDFQDGMSYSLDYLMEGIITILQELIVGIKDDKNIGDEPESDLLAEKSKKLFAKSSKLQERREKLLAVNDKDYHKNMSLFERACMLDEVNESCPTPEMITRKFQHHPGALRKGMSSPALLQKQQQETQPRPLSGGPGGQLKPTKEKGGLIFLKKS